MRLPVLGEEYWNPDSAVDESYADVDLHSNPAESTRR